MTILKYILILIFIYFFYIYIYKSDSDKSVLADKQAYAIHPQNGILKSLEKNVSYCDYFYCLLALVILKK